MGVIKATEGRRKKPFRVAIERHGTRFEKWFATEDQAQKAWSSWEATLLNIFGPRSNKKTQERDAKRAAKTNLFREHGLAHAPCGMIKETPIPRRCRDHMQCIHYEGCLDTAFKRSWAGWAEA